MRVSANHQKSVTAGWLGTICAILFAGALPSVVSASAPVGAGDLPGGAITAIRLHDQGAAGNRPASFGLPVTEGVLKKSDSLIITDSTGSELATQWNPLATWRTDGSVLHGVVTFLTPEGDANGIYYVTRGDPGTDQAITKDDLQNAGVDAEVLVNISGVNYQLGLRDLLLGAAAPRMDYTHFTGRISAEFALGGPLRIDGTGQPHSSLQAYFYVRAFNRPVDRAFITVVLENTGGATPLSDTDVDSVDIRVAGQSILGFPKSSFTIYADVRYPVRTWWGGDPGLWVQHDLDYVSATGLMPRYRNIRKDESVLASYPQASVWNSRVILSADGLEGAGSKPEISPFDEWSATYMATGDRRAWNAMRAAQDEYSQMVYKMGSAVVHARDEQTGFPYDLTTKGVISKVWNVPGDGRVLEANRDGHPVAQSDSSHWPAIGYFTYLLTGEFNELENLQHSAIAVWLNEGPGGMLGTIPDERGFRSPIQPRAIGWTLREVVHAAIATPDDHPLRDSLQQSATFYIDRMAVHSNSRDATENLGVWVNRTYLGNSTAFGPETGFPVWQDDYITFGVGLAYKLGWKRELDANGLWSWKVKGVLGRFGLTAGEGSYCWKYAAQYKLAGRPSASEPEFSSWSEVFAANFPEVTSCPAPGTATMGDADSDPTRYGAQIAPALAMAVDTGVPGAAEAWEIYDSRQIQFGWDFSARSAWAITPRHLGPTPTPPTNLIAD